MNSTKPEPDESAIAAVEPRRPHSSRLTGPLASLVSMRMIVLFNLLRRTNSLSQKRVFDLTEIQHRIMTQLGAFAPLSLNSLAELLMQDRGQMSRAVKGMVEHGLLTRTRKPGGPEIEIDLSEQGRALHAQMVARAIERDRRLTEGLDQDDLRVVERVLEQMIKRGEILHEEERALNEQ